MNHDFQRNRKKKYIYVSISVYASKYLSVYMLELAQLMGVG